MVLGIIAGIIGIIGSVLPALPGPLLTYSTLFILYYIGGENLMPSYNLIYIGVIAGLLVIISNLIPVAATKISGASKSGVYGSIIGSIVGLIMFPPLGVFLGAVIGATLGEYYAFSDVKRSISAGVGSTLGTIAVLFIQFIFSISVFVYFLIKALSLL